MPHLANRKKEVSMNKLLKPATVALLLFVAIIPVSAAPARVLTRNVLEKFLQDLPLVQAEMDALENELAEEFSDFEMEDDFGMEDGDFPTLESIQAGIMAVMMHPKVNAILAKHGWTEAFLQTYVAVMVGYSHLAFEEIYQAYPMPQLKEVMDQLSSGVHPDDLALLKEYRTRIEAVLDVDIGL
jgi:hypothetical protein